MPGRRLAALALAGAVLSPVLLPGRASADGGGGASSCGRIDRTNVARCALAVNADILLMDEPFSAVDEQTRRKFQEDLIRLRETERKTFLFVTHSIEEAVYLSDRIVLLSPRPGRISRILEPAIPQGLGPDELRRDPVYLDTVEKIWHGVRRYVE